jgi:hypothetical protein
VNISTILTIILASASAIVGMICVFHLDPRSKPVLHWLTDKVREFVYLHVLTHSVNYSLQYGDQRGMLSMATTVNEDYASFDNNH